MKKINLFILAIAAFSMVFTGCSESIFSPEPESLSKQPSSRTAIQPNMSAANGQPQNNQSTIDYSIVLDGYNYDGTNTTFTYTVVSGTAPSISHWNLQISEECVNDLVIVSSNDPTADYGYDGSTGTYGLKFDTGYEDGETREVTLVLAGEWTAELITILVKSGNGFVLGSALGPVCGGGGDDDTYTISGTVFFDIDGDGIQDPDEPGMGGILVTLNDGSTVVTDENGFYEFEVTPGDYTVSYNSPDGFLPTTSTSVDVTVTNENVQVNSGLELDWNYPVGKTADGYTIGYWKNNISKAMAGKTKGVQVGAATLEAYLNDIASFALYPFTFSDLSEAYSVLSAKGSDSVLLLSKQLLGSELNYFNGAYIGGNEMYTMYFLYYGEYMIVHSDEFSREEILLVKDWYDAYNNSHGDAITLQ